MRVTQRTAGGKVVVDVAGRVDLATSPELRRQLKKLANGSAPQIVVGLEAVETMDSSGVATLLQTLKEARSRGGSLTLAGAGDRVRDILRLCSAEDLFLMHETVAGALGEGA